MSVNIRKAQETVLLNLRKEKSVKVLLADKGRSIVVMDSDEYKEKVAVLLNDTKTYLKLMQTRLNPHPVLRKILTKFYFKSRTRTTAQHHNFSQIYTETALW